MQVVHAAQRSLPSERPEISTPIAGKKVENSTSFEIMGTEPTVGPTVLYSRSKSAEVKAGKAPHRVFITSRTVEHGPEETLKPPVPSIEEKFKALNRYRDQIAYKDMQALKEHLAKGKQPQASGKIRELIHKTLQKHKRQLELERLNKFEEQEVKRMNRELLKARDKTVRQMNALSRKKPQKPSTELQKAKAPSSVPAVKKVKPLRLKKGTDKLIKEILQKLEKREVKPKVEPSQTKKQKLVKEIEGKLEQAYTSVTTAKQVSDVSLDRFKALPTSHALAVTIDEAIEKAKEKPKVVLSKEIQKMLRKKSSQKERQDFMHSPKMQFKTFDTSRSEVVKAHLKEIRKRARTIAAPLAKKLPQRAHSWPVLKPHRKPRRKILARKPSIKATLPSPKVGPLENALFGNTQPWQLESLIETDPAYNLCKYREKVASYREKEERRYLRKLYKAGKISFNDYQTCKRNLHKWSIHELDEVKAMEENLRTSVQRTAEIIEDAQRSSENIRGLMKNKILPEHTDEESFESFHIDLAMPLTDTEDAAKAYMRGELKRKVVPKLLDKKEGVRQVEETNEYEGSRMIASSINARLLKILKGDYGDNAYLVPETFKEIRTGLQDSSAKARILDLLSKRAKFVPSTEILVHGIVPLKWTPAGPERYFGSLLHEMLNSQKRPLATQMNTLFPNDPLEVLFYLQYGILNPLDISPLSFVLAPKKEKDIVYDTSAISAAHEALNLVKPYNFAVSPALYNDQTTFKGTPEVNIVLLSVQQEHEWMSAKVGIVQSPELETINLRKVSQLTGLLCREIMKRSTTSYQKKEQTGVRTDLADMAIGQTADNILRLLNIV